MRTDSAVSTSSEISELQERDEDEDSVRRRRNYEDEDEDEDVDEERLNSVYRDREQSLSNDFVSVSVSIPERNLCGILFI